MPIVLVTDSNCDLPVELIERYQIRVVSSLLNIGGQSYRDGVDISRAEFYERLPSFNPSPTTAAPASGVFEELYRACGEAGATDIISIHIASRLSGFFNAARLGAEASGARVTLIDSEQLSMGFGWQVLAAAEAIAAGKSVAEVVETITRTRQRVKAYAALNTLEHLRRSGRANALVAVLGDLLQIKPLVELVRGEVKLMGRQRTFSKVIEKLVETVQALGPLERLAIMHANNLTDAHRLAEHLTSQCAQTPLVLELAAVIGTHLGPGTVGVAVVRQT